MTSGGSDGCGTFSVYSKKMIYHEKLIVFCICFCIYNFYFNLSSFMSFHSFWWFHLFSVSVCCSNKEKIKWFRMPHLESGFDELQFTFIICTIFSPESWRGGINQNKYYFWLWFLRGQRVESCNCKFILTIEIFRLLSLKKSQSFNYKD